MKKFFYKYYWYDLKDKYINFPKMRKKITKDIALYSFDMVDSSIEILFNQFILLWERWLKDKFEDSEYLKAIENDHLDPKKMWFNAQKEMKIIYRYLKYIRPQNQKLIDDTLDKQYINHRFIPCDDELSEKYSKEKFSTLKCDKTFSMDYYFTSNDVVVITKYKDPDFNNKTSLDIEWAINEIDNKYAKKIIDIRGFLWD